MLEEFAFLDRQFNLSKKRQIATVACVPAMMVQDPPLGSPSRRGGDLYAL